MKPRSKGRGVSLPETVWTRVDERITALQPWVNGLSDYVSRLVELDLRGGLLDDYGAPRGSRGLGKVDDVPPTRHWSRCVAEGTIAEALNSAKTLPISVAYAQGGGVRTQGTMHPLPRGGVSPFWGWLRCVCIASCRAFVGSQKARESSAKNDNEHGNPTASFCELAGLAGA